MSGPAAAKYRRLPGHGMAILRSPSAWLADDHILLIDGTRFSETYRRVYLRDLQALIIRRKARFVWQWPYLLILPLLLFALLGNFRTQIALPFLAATFIAIVAFALFSIRFGCHLHLATAVGSIRVASVSSIPAARRFADRITPAILHAQQPPA